MDHWSGFCGLQMTLTDSLKVVKNLKMFSLTVVWICLLSIVVFCHDFSFFQSCLQCCLFFCQELSCVRSRLLYYFNCCHLVVCRELSFVLCRLYGVVHSFCVLLSQCCHLSVSYGQWSCRLFTLSSSLYLLDYNELIYLGNTLESKKENYERKTCFRLKPIAYVAGNGQYNI